MFRRSILWTATLAISISPGQAQEAREAAPGVTHPSPSRVWWGDYDGDGRDDAWVVLPDGSGRLMHARGDGRYEDVTALAGLSAQAGRRAAWGDVDGDGDLDLFLSSPSGPSRLFVQHEGAFADATGEAGLPRRAAALEALWRDLDGDGDLDLHLSTEVDDRVFANDGNGRFAELDLGLELGLEPDEHRLVGGSSRPAPDRAEGAASRSVPQSPPPAGPPTQQPICAHTVRDKSGTDCLSASSVGMLGHLYPLSADFFVDSATGRVGVGTASPAFDLDVAGTVNASAYSGGQTDEWNAAFDWGDHGQAGYVTFESDPDFNASAAGNITNTDVVNWDATYAEVSANAATWDAAYAWGDHSNAGYLTGSIATDSVPKWNGASLVSGTLRDASSRVGVGRVASTNALEVEGAASKTTAGSWLANSDARIKTDVRELEDPLAWVRRVRMVAFRYTPDYLAKHPAIEDIEYFNVIAQEFAEVFPDWVQDSGEEGLLQVDTYPVFVHAVAAVQELARRNEEQAGVIRALEERMQSLETELAGLSELEESLKELRALLPTREE